MHQQKGERMLIQQINAACAPRVNAPSDHLAPDRRLPGTATANTTLDTQGRERGEGPSRRFLVLAPFAVS
jgi:hypothetical protein